jgi:membrane protein
LLWFGAIVGLWTAASFVENDPGHPPPLLTASNIARPSGNIGWGSMLVIVGAVILLMIAFAASTALTIAHMPLSPGFRWHREWRQRSGSTGSSPADTLFFTFYVLFYALTPSRYRKRGCRKWPGALLITVWWLATVEICFRRSSAPRWIQPDLRQPRRSDDCADLLFRRRLWAWSSAPN